MGAYLSQPVVKKISSDEANTYIDVGASSMQGWRISQEDAHNCVLNYDTDTSLFAVYDGHGGAEIAAYCAENLPKYLKEITSYKNGDYEQALKDAFLEFDATLLQENVIEILQRLAYIKNPNDELSECTDEEEEENIYELYKESDLPLEQVLEKYKGRNAKNPYLQKLTQNELGMGSSGSNAGASKPMSPFLRGRRNDINAERPSASPSSSSTCPSESSSTFASGSASTATESVSEANTSQRTDNTHSIDTCVKMEADADDSTVSSSSGNNDNTKSSVKANEVGEDVASSSSISANGAVSKCSPDSSSNNPIEKRTLHQQQQENISEARSRVRNGNLIGSPSNINQENEITTNSPVKSIDTKTDIHVTCSSSTAASSSGLTPLDNFSKQENGEISSNSNEVSSNLSRNATAALLKDAVISIKNIAASKVLEKNLKRSFVDEESEDDSDFQAEEDNSSTEDGEEECKQYEDETEEEIEEEIEDENEEEREEEESGPGKDSGCTAVIAIMNGRDLYVANAGDSRCVVCREGKAIEMSLDHKPEDPTESYRIIMAGGKVTADGRVNGGLNLSRAIGDHAYKMNKKLPPEKQMISAMPDVRKLIISPEDEFMIIACDGIWNFMSSDEVIEYVKKRINEGEEKMSAICEELFVNCLAPNTNGDGTGCDNMTAIIVRFKKPILELPTKISVESEAIPLAHSNKRAASPTLSELSNNDEADASNIENSSKRQKTEHDGDKKDCVSSPTNTNEDVEMPSTSENISSHQSTTSKYTGVQLDMTSDVSDTTTTTNKRNATVSNPEPLSNLDSECTPTSLDLT